MAVTITQQADAYILTNKDKHLSYFTVRMSQHMTIMVNGG